MCSPRLSFIVLKCSDPGESLKFYEELGFKFVEEQHDLGPRHWSTELASDLVLEIFPASENGSLANGENSSLTLGLEVESVTEITERLHSSFVLRTTTKGPGKGLTAVVRDPEGRRIFLSNKT